ncbi:MAG: hypothetical protein ACJ75I_00130 [Solirubrobacterales bacterium]
MRGQKRLAGALAVVAVAMAISSCGSSGDDATIPQDNANQLLSALNGVQSAVDAQDCKLAEERAQAFINSVNALPDTVGTADKEMLRRAGVNLQNLAQDPTQCKPEPATGPSGDTGVEPTTPTTTVPTTPTTTTTSTTTQPEPPPDTGGGNEGNGGGPPTDTGGGPPTDTGGGGETGGGGGEVGGGSGGTGGTGTGGTGGGGGGNGRWARP